MNNKGFVTLGLIVFFPVAFLLTLALMWSVFFINKKNQINNLCYQYALQAQDHLLKGNKHILALNPKALFLIQQKKALDTIIIAAPPPGKLAALKQRARVVSQQKLLRLQQRTQLNFSEWNARKQLFDLRRKLKRKLSSFHDQKISPSAISISILGGRSQLKTQIRDIAPTYKRGAKHEMAQAIEVNWSLNSSTLFPKWLAEKIQRNKRWRGRCASHPHKRSFQWISKIGRGRH